MLWVLILIHSLMANLEAETFPKSLTQIQESRSRFIVEGAGSRIRCLKKGNNFFGSTKRYKDLEECINSNEMAHYKDSSGKCLLVSIEDHHPIVIKEVNPKNCDSSDTSNYSNLSKENNYRNFLLNEAQTTCQHIGLCFSILKEEDNGFLDNLQEVLSKIDMKDRALTDAHVSRELQKLKKVLASCSSSTLIKAEEDDIQAALLLRRDLEKMIKTLPHDTDVYHWFEASSMMKAFRDEFPEKSIPTRLYADYMQSLFFASDKPGGTGNQGRGLYASRTLSDTDKFGENLLKITIPEGSRYIDMGGSSKFGTKFILEEDTIKELKDIGCPIFAVSDHNSLVRNQVEKASFSSNKRCRQVFNEVIKDLDVGFMNYRYSTTQPAVCNKEHTSAFVLIDIDFNKDNVSSYTLATKDENGNLRNRYTDLPEGLKEDFLVENQKAFRELTPEEKKRLRDKWRERIFECE